MNIPIEAYIAASAVVGFAIGFITCALFGRVDGSDWGDPETAQDEHETLPDHDIPEYLTWTGRVDYDVPTYLRKREGTIHVFRPGGRMSDAIIARTILGESARHVWKKE
jgi:hypothetical protein